MTDPLEEEEEQFKVGMLVTTDELTDMPIFCPEDQGDFLLEYSSQHIGERYAKKFVTFNPDAGEFESDITSGYYYTHPSSAANPPRRIRGVIIEPPAGKGSTWRYLVEIQPCLSRVYFGAYEIEEVPALTLLAEAASETTIT